MVECELLTYIIWQSVSHFEHSHAHRISVIFLRLFRRCATEHRTRGADQKIQARRNKAASWSYPISLFVSTIIMNTGAPSNAIESYCTFTLAPDVTAGGLPSEDEIAKDLESTDDSVSMVVVRWKMTLGRGMMSRFACLFAS